MSNLPQQPELWPTITCESAKARAATGGWAVAKSANSCYIYIEWYEEYEKCVAIGLGLGASPGS